MPKDFRGKLEEYLLSLEKELSAPERYRNSVMTLFDKTEDYGKRELSDNDFERIKCLARNSYLNIIDTQEHTSKIRESFAEEVKGLEATAESLYQAASEIEKEEEQLNRLKKSDEAVRNALSQLEKELKKLKTITKKDTTLLN